MDWEEKRREEIQITIQKNVNTGYISKIIQQEKQMLREFAIKIFDNHDEVMIHKYILNERINKLLSDMDIENIIKNNKSVDIDLLIKSKKEFEELKKMGVTMTSYNFVLPYSRNVKVDK